MPSSRFSIAPMMGYSNRHARYLLRQITRHALIYTEMLNAHAVCHGDTAHLLAHHPTENPVAIQLGGRDSNIMAEAARHVEGAGYDEVNINVGCPSDRVQAGCFGAALMAEPAVVADCVAAMRKAVSLPITVKTRIGIEGSYSYPALVDFVETVAAAGCRRFIIHARTVWLKGLNPKENRSVPPLRYDIVQRLKEDFPQLEIILNGGITQLSEASEALAWADGIMLGRAAYQNPYLLATVDQEFFDSEVPAPSRAEILKRFLPYAERELAQGTSLRHLIHPLLPLTHGIPGAKAWRRYLSESATRPGADSSVLRESEKLLQATN